MTKFVTSASTCRKEAWRTLPPDYMWQK